MPTPVLARLAVVIAVLFALGLAACSPTIGLDPALTARMDAPGAHLDTRVALSMVNHLRQSRGAAALVNDPALEAAAQQAARAYAASGKSPNKPDAAGAVLTSAGYLSFAETFSGWRASDKDTAALSDSGMHRAGLAVSWNGNTEFGSYWVLLMAP